MSGTDDLNLDLAQFVRLSVAEIDIACRLFVSDPGFRALYEDYSLARSALARFTELAETSPPGAIHEYNRLIAELEVEIVEAIAKAAQTAGHPSCQFDRKMI